jgi:hypothetical protein
MRAALYARTACLTQDLKSAVELQLEALRNYATQKGMEIVEEFSDAGYSGLRRDRPGLNHMCEVAARRGFDVLLTRDAERLARNWDLLISLLEELERCGVRTIFLEGRPAELRHVTGASAEPAAHDAHGLRNRNAGRGGAMRKLDGPEKKLARGSFRLRSAAAGIGQGFWHWGGE